jgi:hypothetical protein
MKHTPTPWHVTDQSEIEGINIDGLELKSLATMSKSGNITYVHGEMLDSDDAAFIVQACNSHDALVAALEGFHPRVIGSGNSLSIGQLARAWETAKEALKLARGE